MNIIFMGETIIVSHSVESEARTNNTRTYADRAHPPLQECMVSWLDVVSKVHWWHPEQRYLPADSQGSCDDSSGNSRTSGTLDDFAGLDTRAREGLLYLLSGLTPLTYRT